MREVPATAWVVGVTEVSEMLETAACVEVGGTVVVVGPVALAVTAQLSGLMEVEVGVGEDEIAEQEPGQSE